MSGISEALTQARHRNARFSAEGISGLMTAAVDMPEAPAMEAGGLEEVDRITWRPHSSTRLLGLSGSDFAAGERFKLLRHRLYELRSERTLKSVLITSAIPQDGKSTVAANLAVTLAQSSRRVLLVDADLRKPSLEALFGLMPHAGLAEVLGGRVKLASVCRRIDPANFFFLAAGTPPSNPVELIEGELMRRVVESAAATLDWVVIDSPPVLPLADGRFLASMCDAVIFVVREAHSRYEDIQAGLAALNGAFIAGIVVNTNSTADLGAYSYYASSFTEGQAAKAAGYHVPGAPKKKPNHFFPKPSKWTAAADATRHWVKRLCERPCLAKR